MLFFKTFAVFLFSSNPLKVFIHRTERGGLLQTLMQSYQNVSNSQQNTSVHQLHGSCKRLCKVIKMLAIHNYTQDYDYILDVANAYAKLSKC